MTSIEKANLKVECVKIAQLLMDSYGPEEVLEYAKKLYEWVIASK